MKIKRKLLLLPVVCMLFAAALLGAACIRELPDNSQGVTVRLTVVGSDSAAVYDGDISSTASAFGDLLNQAEGIDAQINPLGYLDAVTVNGVTMAGDFDAGFYLALYHTIDDLKYKDAYMAAPMEYEGKRYFYSGVGAAELPVVDGQSYLVIFTAF